MHRRIPRFALFVTALVVCSGSAFAGATITETGDLVITKAEITATATFYQYRLDNLLMEVLALRAPDGSVRTAFNTCQVCYNSGRGYYVQQGEYLVCQNCGNRFRSSQVELARGGCNPLGITKDMKIETSTTITIPKADFVQARQYFLRWKR